MRSTKRWKLAPSVSSAIAPDAGSDAKNFAAASGVSM